MTMNLCEISGETLDRKFIYRIMIKQVVTPSTFSKHIGYLKNAL